MFTKDDLGRLVAVDAAPAVSVFLPTHVAGREIRQDPIRLRNLLGDAVERLMTGGLRRPDAEALVAPASRLVDDGGFWRHQNNGLALFMTRDLFEAHRVPMDLPEEVVVSKGFSVRPLLPLLAAEGSFMILAATADGARLYLATRHGISEEDADLPGGAGDVHDETDYDPNSLHQPGHMRHHDRRNVAATSVKTHNFGESPEELRHAHLIEYLRRLADRVEHHIAAAGFKGPLILVADDEVQGHLRGLLGNVPSLLHDAVNANAESMSIEDMHRRAFALVRPLFDRDRGSALDRFRALAADTEGRFRAVTRLEDIIRAGNEGRVDTLLVEGSVRLWGRYDTQTDRVISASNAPNGDSVDLLEHATAQTLLRGGEVHVVSRSDLPPDAIAAAILRY
ncbi:hypothetical protein [Azospirillum halopraeferens]|uniref:baeRF3 domain-containing protein n=1 Tax=Azospirillum halopraeferens TaxID=34010 RepID=UPI0004177C01|nr:hypothetical protein [Azospirillum halopraeferens]